MTLAARLVAHIAWEWGRYAALAVAVVLVALVVVDRLDTARRRRDWRHRWIGRR